MKWNQLKTGKNLKKGFLNPSAGKSKLMNRTKSKLTHSKPRLKKWKLKAKKLL